MIPPDSSRYDSARTWAGRFDQLFTINWSAFFAIWSLLLAGMGSAAAIDDRYLYWLTNFGWGGFLFFIGTTFIITGLFGLKQYSTDSNNRIFWALSATGIICLLLADVILLAPMALIMVILGPAMGYKAFDFEDRSIKLAGLYLLLFYLLFLTGWLFQGGTLMASFTTALPYVLAAEAVLLVFWIGIEPDGSSGFMKLGAKNHRAPLLAGAIILDAAATVIGYLLDDPVISTAACVYLPFLVVALVFPAHIRHIQRARVYPIFILAMLVAVRYAWYLLALALNFWILRSYTYLRFGDPKPTFRVDYDQN